MAVVNMNRAAARLTWLLLWILSWLPGFIMKFLSYLINTIVFGVFQYRSKVIGTNLIRSFPELTLTERKSIAEKFYQHFSEIFLEMVVLIRLRPTHQSGRIRFTNPEVMRKAFSQKQNIIIIAGHYGNWEWTLLPFLESGYRVLAVYKPQSSKLANQLMKDIRQKPGVLLVPMKETLRVITREIKNNSSPFALLLVGDQIPARGDIRFWTPFLNQDTAFFTGAEKLARRFGFPVFYVDQKKPGFARYEVTVTPVYDGISKTEEGAITTAFAGLLEASIRREPSLWLWSHRRWKYPREKLNLQV